MPLVTKRSAGGGLGRRGQGVPRVPGQWRAPLLHLRAHVPIQLCVRVRYRVGRGRDERQRSKLCTLYLANLQTVLR